MPPPPLYTVLLLRGPLPANAAAVVVDGDDVRVDCSSPAPGADAEGFVTLTDAGHGAVLRHRGDRHQALTLVSLERVTLAFDCAWCARRCAVVGAHGGDCPRCGGTLAAQLAAGPVRLHIKNKRGFY